jgi:hypothetical protein
MTQSDIENSLRDIISALQQYEEPTITGQHLGEFLIPRAASSLNVREAVGKPFGSGALKTFISLYLSDYLVPVDRRGADIVYRILPASPDARTGIGTAAPSAQIWTTFASPSSPYKLFLNRTTHQVVVLSNSVPSIPDDLTPIPSVSVSELNRIRSDFMSTIAADADSSALRDRLNATDDYSSWVSLLRTDGPSDYNRWSSFRRHGIEALFKSRLAELDIGDEANTALLQQLRDSQMRANRFDMRKSSAAPIKRDNRERQGTPQDYFSPPQGEQDFRRLLIEVISRMPSSDIRKICVPYGLAYDVITGDKKR